MTAAGLVRVDRFGAVVVLVLANPPVNALSVAVEAALIAALDAARGDPGVRAVILRGEGRGFSAGADISEAGQVGRMAAFTALCRRVEDFPKPVIAALHGTTLGAGLGLAMAAHCRIAHSGAALGLPEVGLGLLPAGGGTQRLPRLVGGAQALRLMLGGLPIRAPEALALGLVDRVVAENLGEAALAMAGEGLARRPTAHLPLRDMAGYQAAVAAARAADRGDPLPAPGRIIDCVESAALLPFEMGLNFEAAAFEDLSVTPEAHGLHHAFQAERHALQLPTEIVGHDLPALTRLGLWGAGDIAGDLAFQALAAGLHVVMGDPLRERLSQALSRVAALQDQAVGAGDLTEETRDEAWARLSSCLEPQGMAGVELILVPPGAALLPLDVPQGAMGGVASGAGLTVPDVPGGLSELGLAPDAAPDLVLRLAALARRLNWRMVTGGPGGPIELGLRLALDAAEQALRATHPVELVDAVLAAFGMGQASPRNLPAMPHGGAPVLQALLAALAAEGGRMLEDGRARRPGDIDAVALLSGLMPRWQGGPMYQADQRGLIVLRADLKKNSGAVFAVPGLIDRMIAEGQRFATLDRR